MRVDYTDFNDAEHVRRTLRGDKSAFDALVRQYHGMVYSVALARLGHDHDQADELAQEVFLRAWLHLDRLSRPDYFPAWLVQIARNLAADWQRRDRRKSALVQMLSADHPEALTTPARDPSPRDAAAVARETDELYNSLAQLPTDHRELLLLHYGEGHSQSEIARNLGVSPSTVMRRLEKALAGLRQVYRRGTAQDLASSGQISQNRAARTLAVIAAAFLLAPHQKTALAAAAGPALFLPRLLSLKKVAAIGASGAVAAAVIVMAWNYASPALNEPIAGSAERSSRFIDRSVEVRSVGGDKRMGTPEEESTARSRKELLKSQSPEADAVPNADKASTDRKSAELRKSTSADAESPSPGQSDAASDPAAAGTSAAGCPSLKEMVERIRRMEAIAGSAHFTYRSAVTVLNQDHQPDVKDREGTVTVKNGSYLIEFHEPGSGRTETIYYHPARKEVAAVVDLDKPSAAGQHTINTWRSESQIAALSRGYNPLAALIWPPYRDDSLSDFVSKEAQDGAVSVKCAPETTSSVIVSSDNWTMRFQREQYPFFDLLELQPETASGWTLQKSVAEVSSLNGVVYPSVFFTNSHSDSGTFGGLENATTTSLTMLKLGDEVPDIKDPFAELPNARRFDMEKGEVLPAGESRGGLEAANTSKSRSAGEPTLTQKFRDPQIAKQYPQPGMVTGQVVDPEGRPVPNLDIDWAALTHQKPEERQKLLSNLPPTAVVSNQPVQQIGRSTTDANGNFVINSPTTGTAVLATDLEPYARTLQVVDLPTTDVIIRIPAKGATVEGTVRDITTGDPVPGANVRLTPLGKTEFDTGPMGVQTFKPFAGNGVRLEADANGNFRDDRMPAAEIGGEAGTDTLIPVKSKYLNPDNVVLKAGQITRMPDLYVYPGYTVRGYVYEAGTSSPLAGVKVAPGGGIGTLAGKRPEPTTTDASGYYEITRLQPIGGDVRNEGEEPELFFENIYAEAEGYKTAKFGATVEGTFNPQKLVIEHDFELTPWADPEKSEGNLQHIELLPRQ